MDAEGEAAREIFLDAATREEVTREDEVTRAKIKSDYFRVDWTLVRLLIEHRADGDSEVVERIIALWRGLNS